MHHIPHNIEFQMKLLLVFQRNMPSIILIAVVQCIQHSSFLISLNIIGISVQYASYHSHCSSAVHPTFFLFKIIKEKCI